MAGLHVLPNGDLWVTILERPCNFVCPLFLVFKLLQIYLTVTHLTFRHHIMLCQYANLNFLGFLCLPLSQCLSFWTWLRNLFGASDCIITVPLIEILHKFPLYVTFRQDCGYRQAMALLDGRIPPSAPLIKQVQAGNISSTSSSWSQAGLAQQSVVAGSSNAYHTTSFEA